MLHHPFKGKIALEDLEEVEAALILSFLPNVGPIKIKTLLNEFGSYRAVLAAKESPLSKSLGIDTRVWHSWQHWPKGPCWQEDLLLVKRYGINLITPSCQQYPKGLLALADPPPLLYLKGQLLPCDARSIAIVGTRQASIYGNNMAQYFAERLAALGFTVVSGLARGIDTSAHLAALQSGRTVAVIGSGLANVYPAENRSLAETISQKGALISEFPMTTPPDRQNFPRRNRIVSGMTPGALLIEAPLESGAMITMRKSLSYRKKLFALPGRLDFPTFTGNHALIKSGVQLVETPEEIAQAFDSLLGCLPKQLIDKEIKIHLDREEQELLSLLPIYELSIEEIAMLTRWPIAKLNAYLMSLVLKKVLKEYPGRVYKKV